ncbi:MAG: hypothetical protein AB2A00_29545 [Myxococcota bacterium]
MSPARRQRLAHVTRRTCLVAAAVIGAILLLPPLLGLFYFGLDLDRVELGILCDLASPSTTWRVSAHLANGGPVVADPQYQLLYPVRWLLFLLPPDAAITTNVVLHLAGAAAGAAWLARTFHVRPLVAASAGIAFAFCGTSLDLIRHQFYLVAATWLPVVWAAVRRQRVAPRLSSGFMVLGLVGCLLGGDAQAFGIGVGIVLLEGVFRRGSGMGRAALGVAAAALVGTLLWIPALSEMALTGRGGGLDLKQALIWSHDPLSWLAMLEPALLTTQLQADATLWSVLHGVAAEEKLPWNVTPYVGPLLLACALVGFSQRRLRSAALLATVAMVFALGEHSPLMPALMRSFPPLALFRYPQKYLVIASLALVVLAGGTLDVVVRRRRARTVLPVALGLMLAFQVALLVWVALNRDALDALVTSGAGALELARTAALPSLSDALLRSATMGAVPVFAALLLLWRARVAVLPLLLTTELILVAASTVNVGPSLVDAHSPLMVLPPMSPDPPPVLCHHPDVYERTLGIPDAPGPWGGALLLRLVAAPSVQSCDGLNSGHMYSPLTSRVRRQLGGGVGRDRSAASRALGCTHLISDRAPREGDTSEVTVPGFDRITAVMGLRVHAIDDPIPTVFIARAASLKVNEDDVINAIGLSRTAEEVVAVVDDPLQRRPNVPLPDGKGAQVTAREWPSRDHARVTLAGSGGAVVGLRTSFQAGWRAQQDGRELPVVRSSGVHVAAVADDVTAGPVEFRYEVPRWPLAWALACSGLALLLALLMVGRRARV